MSSIIGETHITKRAKAVARRKLLQLIDAEGLNNPHNSIIKTWKTCADILCITKTKLPNVYHCMLSIATASSSCWDRVIDFMFLWK